MTTDERNFRSAYYEKVGCRGVEEKRSLNILLKDQPHNRTKLKQFCLNFTVPTTQRSLLWNLILGVLPTYSESTDYVMEQNKAVFEDTQRAVKVMKYVDEKTPKAKMFYAMWLIENRKLHSDFILESSFIPIVDTLLQIFDSDVEIYWIAKKFYEFTIEIRSDFPKLKEMTFTLLEKEDLALYHYFNAHNVLNNLPLEKWYTSCFAGMVSEQALVKIWDKICGGSRKILVFLLIVLLKTLKMALMRCSDAKEIRSIIERKKDDQDDLIIVNKAIESWHNNKSHNEFMVHRKDN